MRRAGGERGVRKKAGCKRGGAAPAAGKGAAAHLRLLLRPLRASFPFVRMQKPCGRFKSGDMLTCGRGGEQGGGSERRSINGAIPLSRKLFSPHAAAARTCAPRMSMALMNFPPCSGCRERSTRLERQ